MKLIEEFLYDVLKEGKSKQSQDALRDVFGTSDVGELLTQAQVDRNREREQLFGKTVPSNTPEAVAAEQALAVSKKSGGIKVGNNVIPHEDFVKLLADPKFKQYLVAARSSKDPVVRSRR